jgi:hypothetical protein
VLAVTLGRAVTVFYDALVRSLRESASSVIDGHIEICEALHDLIARGQE